jgi:hypothetical protein
MNAELAEGGALELAIGRMIFDPLHVAAKLVALVQHRPMAIGKPRAFVQPAAGKFAQAIKMRLDVTEQRVGKMQAKQILQRRVGAVEIHARRIRGQQSGSIGIRSHAAMLQRLH